MNKRRKRELLIALGILLGIAAVLSVIGWLS
jgi:cytochrome c-type biogenesis protein CcmE